MHKLPFSGLALLGLLLSMLVNCSSNDVANPPAESAGSGQADGSNLHAVMSEQLIVDSARLNVLLFDLHRTETVLARERGEQIVRIGESARSLRDGAARVLELASSLPLTTADQVRFADLANQLQGQAGTLASLAEAGQLSPAQMETSIARVNETCSACHNLYRNSQGVNR